MKWLSLASYLDGKSAPIRLPSGATLRCSSLHCATCAANADGCMCSPASLQRCQAAAMHAAQHHETSFIDLICCALTAPRPRRWPLLSSLASVDLNITRLHLRAAARALPKVEPLLHGLAMPLSWQRDTKLSS